jgi:hypothetical protein
MRHLKLFESESKEYLKDYSIEKIDRNTYRNLLRTKKVTIDKNVVSKLLEITPIYGSKLEYVPPGAVYNSPHGTVLVNDDYEYEKNGEPIVINQVEDYYYIVMDKKTSRGEQRYYKCDDIGGLLKLLIIRHVFRLEEIKKVIDI